MLEIKSICTDKFSTTVTILIPQIIFFYIFPAYLLNFFEKNTIKENFILKYKS